MALLRRRDPETYRRLVGPALCLAALVALVVSTRSLDGYPRRIGLTVFGAVQGAFSAVGDFVTDRVAAVAELRRLKASHEELLGRMERFVAMERDFADIKAENDRLREQLGFASASPGERLPARIVAKDPENLYATMTIDKGSAQGVRKNMAVVAFQDGVEGLVGKVLEVGASNSIVVPVYDRGSYVAARLAKGRYEGLVRGQGRGEGPLVMNFVRKRAKDETQYGDLVVTSGLESIYPPELAIGRVARVRALDYQTSVDLELDPALEFSRLEYVFVLTASPGAAR